LEGIGNTIEVYVKSYEATKQRIYTSYAHMCVYLNISNPLSSSTALEYHDEKWSQTIDYEHIPIHCRKFHEHGNQFRDCSMNAVGKSNNPEENKSRDDFTHVAGRQRQTTRKAANKEPPSNKSFDVLQKIPEYMDEPQIPPQETATHNNTKGTITSTPFLE
jgi:hypothetical protein